jgi:hypothetical protein
MKTMLVSALIHLYPKAWRTEYGAELAAMLQARPLTARVCSDVVQSAMWQRLRAIETPTWGGLGLMAVTNRDDRVDYRVAAAVCDVGGV